MNNLPETNSSNPSIAILGVPFDPVTMTEAIGTIKRMVVSRNPHYVVTANVDFLVQARADVELRRILLDAHLVLGDGTPVVWASRLLGNPLPERVAGADLVPKLVRIASEQKLRVFFLGGTPESMDRAIANVKATYPNLQIEGYSPPFHPLLEMDHDEIKHRITRAKPDLLFVAFGCPKQEKWMAMHYQSLGVPVAIGVGGTIDFLAGQLKRAPVWMQRTGTEWIFRLLQEPRRLFRRYARDLGVFGMFLFAQWYAMQLPKFFRRLNDPGCSHTGMVPDRSDKLHEAESALKRCKTEPKGTLIRNFAPGPLFRHRWKKAARMSCRLKAGDKWQCIQLPCSLDVATVRSDALLAELAHADGRHCLLQMDRVRLIDSTGMSWLMRLNKRLRATGRHLILVAPTPKVKSILKLMRLASLFATASDLANAQNMLRKLAHEESQSVHSRSFPSRRILPKQIVTWRGEITAANANPVWQATEKLMTPTAELLDNLVIDLSQVRFIDSSGLGLMVRARKLAQRHGIQLSFAGVQPAVLNVLRVSRLESILLEERM